MPKCEICGKKVKTEIGLKIHKAHKHDIRSNSYKSPKRKYKLRSVIKTLFCPTCGQKFTVELK